MMPTRVEAELELALANELNPGLGINHSKILQGLQKE